MEFKPEILFEDNHLIAINKPSGMLSQGDRTGDLSIRDHMMNYIKARDKKPGNVFLHPVHRLDRPVSGCLLMAKTSKALSRLAALFKERKVTKSYVAISTSNDALPELGRSKVIRGFIRKDRTRNIVTHSFKEMRDGKEAITEIERLSVAQPYQVILCRPQTGRAHQIRIQLSAIGLPIVGDVKYGGDKADPRSIYLHAFQLSFVHPVRKEEVTIKAQVPSDGLWQSLEVDTLI